MEENFKIDVGQMLTDLAKKDPAGKALHQRWLSLELKPREEYLLVNLFPPEDDNWLALIEGYTETIQYLRGLSENNEAWFYGDQIDPLTINSDTLIDKSFVAQLLFSINLWHTGYHVQPVLRLLQKFEEYTNGDFLFKELNDNTAAFYSRYCLLLFVNYFENLYDDWQSYFFNSIYLQLAIVLGIKLDEPIQRAVDYHFTIADRRELTTEYAVRLYENPIEIGRDLENNGTKIGYWIDQFRLFSKKKFSAIDLLNFMNSTERWKNTLPKEKIIIREMLYLYTALIGTQFIVPEAQIAKKIKPAEIKISPPAPKLQPKTQPKPQPKPVKSIPPGAKEIRKIIDAQFPKDKKGNYIDISGVFAKLGELAEQYGDVGINELLYWDEVKGKFWWK